LNPPLGGLKETSMLVGGAGKRRVGDTREKKPW